MIHILKALGYAAGCGLFFFLGMLAHAIIEEHGGGPRSPV